MIGIDTNVLVRFLVRDDEVQAKRVYNLFMETEAKGNRLFVPIVVVLETLWVLESAYSVSRPELLEIFTDLLLLPVLQFETVEAISGCLSSARTTTLDLSDLLIGHCAKQAGCAHVVTFDRKTSTSQLFGLLG